ncbi:hypothetical protein [Polaribacter sp. M15]
MNAKPLDSEKVKTTKGTNIETKDDFSCAGDCVADSRAGALAFSSDTEDRSADGELMEWYGLFYESCMDARDCPR